MSIDESRTAARTPGSAEGERDPADQNDRLDERVGDPEDADGGEARDVPGDKRSDAPRLRLEEREMPRDRRAERPNDPSKD